MARILVVDDEEDVRHFVRLVLESAGHEVSTAADGQEGIEAIQARRPDLVVLDLMMPVLDGWQVLERVGHVHPPVIVVLSAAADIRQVQERGAAAALSKPFRVPELIATCQRVLAAAAAPPPQG